MGKKVLSIEIGLHNVKVCELEAGKKNPHVLNCITFDTPENIVEDGFILDKDLMAQTLKSQLENAKMNTKEAIFTIASTKLANREVVIPGVPDNKIQSIIDASATEYFPLDVSEYTISYTILEKINTKEEKKLKLLLLAAPNNLIKNIYSFAEIAGLHVNAIDYIGNSTYQIMKGKIETGVNVSVQINDQTTIVNVIENDKLALQRTISYGAMNIVSAVLDNTVFGKNSTKDAMQLLMQEGIINAHLDMGGESSGGMSVASDAYDKIMREYRGREEVTSTIHYIMNNVNRVLDYYMSRNSDKRINTIYLMGVGSKFKGIEILMANETGFDVKKIDNLFGITFSKGLNLASQADYLSAIGATIAPVGFVPEDARTSNNSGGEAKAFMALFGGACIIGAALIIGSFANLQMARIKGENLQKEIDQKVYIENVYASHQAAKESYEYTRYMYNQTSNRNFQLNEFLEMAAQVMPSNMQVLSIISDTNSISMNIEAKSNKYSITELLLQLKKIPSVANATVSNITESTEEGNKKDAKETFTVVCEYNPYNAFVDENTALKDEEVKETEETANPDTQQGGNAGASTENTTAPSASSAATE
ncbi:MAG: pilus assembly protein PilM [Lachnospiraceae bacterium]|nr:pilus assembly protein PilM [Lachnospiraceae bacterium]